MAVSSADRTRPSYAIVGIGEVLWDLLPAGRQLGGAPANFAYHARALGADGIAASRVGDDELGREVLARFDALGLDRRYVQTDAAHPTGTVEVRIDAHGVPDYVIRQDVAWDYLAADPSLIDLAGRADAVCYGTLAQRSPVTRQTLHAFLRVTRPGCLRVFDINLRQSYFSREVIDATLRSSDVLKLNDQELPVVARLLGLNEPTDDAARALIDRYRLRLLALTRGGQGSRLYNANGTVSDHPGFPATIVDTVGAGDAFTAALTLGLLDGHDLDRINTFANRLASYVCSHPGATPPVPKELVAQR